MNMEYFAFSRLAEANGNIRTFFAKSAPQVLPIIAPKPLCEFSAQPTRRLNTLKNRLSGEGQNPIFVRNVKLVGFALSNEN
jgi:hypothetical protein